MSKLTPPVNEDDHVSGPPSALVTLGEYGDYQCPHCAAAFPVIKAIQKEFGKQLRLAYRHFPLATAHPMAVPAATAAEAAGKQLHFWQMHDMIFENQALLSGPMLIQAAEEIGLNVPRFKMDLHDETLAEKIDRDFESGVRSGVNGTPTFFINGYAYRGGYDFESLFGAIEQAILSLH